MSLILDALKKLEREKSLRRSEGINIARDILQPDRGPSRKKPVFLFIGILLTAVAASAVTYTMVGFSVPPEPSPPAPAAAPVALAVESSSPQGLPAQLNPEKAEAPSGQKVTHSSRVPAARTEAKPGVKKERRSVPAAKPVAAIGTLNRSEDSHPKESAQVPPPLKISCIIWYEERADRRVVVNGMTIGEGASIDGVKVEEIYPNRVRFSQNGRSFEVSGF